MKKIPVIPSILTEKKTDFFFYKLYLFLHSIYKNFCGARIDLLMCLMKIFLLAETLNKTDCQSCAVILDFNKYVSKYTLASSNRSQTREFLGFEKLSDNRFSFPSHLLHNYSFPSVPNLPHRPSPSSHTHGS